jgi:hypothetical protein
MAADAARALASVRPKVLPAVTRALPPLPAPRRASPRYPQALTPAVAVLAVVALLLGGCASDDPEVHGPTVQVSDGGRTLLLDEGGRQRELVELPEEDGALVHATVRPGEHDQLTVLALARVEEPWPASDDAEITGGAVEDSSTRYELRYLVVDDEASELFWFPWRLQVDATVAQVLDVPPVPVWAPDGSAVAWVEWSATDGTKLRTVGWIDDGFSQNPSDDASVYRLAEVPAGVQLDHWETDAEGNAVMVGAGDGANWRITVDLETGTLAAGIGPDGLSPGR